MAPGPSHVEVYLSTLCLWLLTLLLAPLTTGDRVRITEAARLVQELGDRLWPGQAGTPMRVLLLRDSTEFLVGHDAPGKDFTATGDSLLRHRIWTRPGRFPPTLVATFPLQGAPTIVVGSPERTGMTSTRWVLTLLHEHFHQWQYSRPWYYPGVAKLGLSGGDSTGMWMLNYAFPYDSLPVREAVRRLALTLRAALDPESGAGIEPVVRARDALRNQLSAADYRYFEFQLWQEGVARYIEYRAANLASHGKPLGHFAALPDYQPYAAAATERQRGLLQELGETDLQRNRRVSFYPIGAAIALLLDRSGHPWKQAYSRRPFVLATLLDIKGE
ncbi:MAG TPA: hypothetical protein VJU17_12460 [Gemmatimonadales bacterium]|nr:hypothetical protein [Gemmatimonadales bacterium]